MTNLTDRQRRVLKTRKVSMWAAIMLLISYLFCSMSAGRYNVLDWGDNMIGGSLVLGAFLSLFSWFLIEMEIY
jgi:hypothetical protein